MITWTDNELYGVTASALNGYLRLEVLWLQGGYRYRIIGARVSQSKLAYASVEEAEQAAEKSLRRILEGALK